jgi:ATP-dependent helicase/nuclease subunit A
MTALYDEVKRRQREERMRLLYVAMTRAERWLIVCGAGEPSSDGESWYDLVRDGLEKAGAADVSPPAFDGAPVRRHDSGIWPEAAAAVPVAEGIARAALPDWVRARPAMLPAPDKSLSPSQLGGAKAIGGEEGDDPDRAMLRGTVLHRLLEVLPGWPEAEADALLAAIRRESEERAPVTLAEGEYGDLLASARAILAGPGLTAPDGEALLEVEVSGALPELGGRMVHGSIDRLIVEEARILAIDYKSNATVPDRPEQVPEGILRQMGAYAALLAQIYPDRRIETAILWTANGALMALPPDMVRAALAATPIP